MAKPLDTKQVATTQEIAISNMLEIEALDGSSPYLLSSNLISITY